jgi:integrase
MLLHDFFRREYLSYSPGLSPKTIKLYDCTIRAFSASLGRPALLEDITRENVAGYLRRLIELERRPATVNKERCQLLALARFARDEGLLAKVPNIKPVPEPERVPVSLTVEQVCRLKRATCILSEPERSYFRALISIQYATGERVGAVAALQWSDIDGDIVTFRAETRKGGRKSNVRRLSEGCLRELARLPRNGPNVFPWRTGDTVIHTRAKRLFEAAGINRPKGRSMHLLRSTHATLTRQMGGDATEALGHASERTTRKHYIDPRFSREFPRLPDVG